MVFDWDQGCQVDDAQSLSVSKSRLSSKSKGQ
jgi:hypothetical protein